MGKVQRNMFTISGKVLFVGMPVYYSEKMSKRILSMEVYADQKFKQEVAFDFVNENMELLLNIRPEDWVDISFQLRGKRHIQKDGKARWFVNIEGLSCIKLKNNGR